MLGGTVLILLGGKTLLGFFVDSGSAAAVADQGWNYLKVTSVFYLILCVWQILAAYLRGMADAVFPLIVGTIQIAANLGGIFLLEPRFGISGIWYSVPVSWSLCALVVLWRSRKRWKTG